MATTPHPIRHRELISRILQYQDLDSLLRMSVALADLELGGHGCSLFLRNAGGNDLVLTQSTVLTRFVGQPLLLDFESRLGQSEKIRTLLAAEGKKPEELDRTLTESDLNGWSDELVERVRGFSLTRWAIHFRCPLVIERIHADVRWSGSAEKAAKQHCELTRTEIGSIAIAPFFDAAEGLPSGVIRVVRKKARRGLSTRKLEWLSWFAGEFGRCMDVAMSLADLMDLGAKLEVEDFGESLVRLLERVLRVRGCSIFLELSPAQNEVRNFQCIATTGVFKNNRQIPKEKARYKVYMRREETDSLTGWVLRNGQLLAVDSSVEFDANRFPGLMRSPGHGHFSESDPKDPRAPGGPILISPLFLHQGREVAGAIRIVRPREKGQDFQVHEQMLFLDISRRISKILTNLNLRQVSEELIALYDRPEEVLDRVPREVSRLLGVEGCSVLRLRDRRYLELAATRGRLAEEKQPIVYDISDPEQHGRTGWVAYKKRALLLNSPAEAKQRHPEDPPKHSPSFLRRACEVADRASYRFLGVPIFREPDDTTSEVLGVIRAPRNKEDPPFEENHRSILVSFAARLSVALNMAQRTDSLEAVAELANPVEILRADSKIESQRDPESIAKEVAHKAVNLLITKVGLAAGAIYELDRQKDKPKLLYSHSVLPVDQSPTEASWEKNLGFNEFPIRLGVIKLGTIRYVAHDRRPATDRQQTLVGLLAGVCASALFNKATFEKLESIRRGLAQVGEEITSDSALVEKLEVIAEVAAEVTLANNVIIHEYLAPQPGEDVTRGRFRESACGGTLTPSEWKETDFKADAVPFKVVGLEEDLFERVAEASAVVFHAKEGENFIQREGIQSVAALPLNVSDTCVGCIFFNFRTRQRFSPQQRHEIQMMAEYAAMAIYQGRLLDETKKLVQEKDRLLGETRQLAQEKSNLLRYADHGLAQPLNALLGYLSNLADGVYNDNASTPARQYFMLGKYVTYLVDTFLRIDDIEAQRLFEIQPREGNLSSVCRHVTDVAEAYLCCSIEQNIDDNIHGRFDENAIRMALLNVLVNAGKHGELPIKLTLEASDERNSATITIDDSGEGIKGAHTLVFERGYRARPESSGLGIGLFLSRGYVEAHNGNISIGKSSLGGARFEFSLPLS